MATSTYLRRMHRRRIIETVARCGRVSRSGLARATGMSQPTVSRIVDGLLSEHILAESDDDVLPRLVEAARRDAHQHPLGEREHQPSEHDEAQPSQEDVPRRPLDAA